jgi:excisionase family DNA binding protein
VSTEEAERAVLPTDVAAAYLGLSPKTLETLRTRGGGPPFLKLGRRVVYRKADLDTWLAARVRHSTSDPGQQ